MSRPMLGVIGAGAWGTALAQMLAQDGSEVLIWAREPEVVGAINAEHRNPLFLPDAPLAPSLVATGNLADLATIPTILLVTPAQHLGAILGQLPRPGECDLVLCSKGIEAGSGRLMADVAHAAAPGSRLAVLSGPTFAHEVAAGLPTAVTLACAGGERLAAGYRDPLDALARPRWPLDANAATVRGAGVKA